MTGSVPATTGLLRIDGPDGWAEISLQGAQVLAWAPRGQESALWLSATSRFGAGAAIRGGVPICFPWFGPLEGHPDAPRHGFARTSVWTHVDTHDDGGDVVVRLRLTDSDATRASAWPYRFEAVCTVVVGARLTVGLEVTNLDDVTVSYEEALHTYLAVDDVTTVEVAGLEGVPFVDKLAASDGPLARETGTLHLDSAVDRVYVGTRGEVTVREGASGRAVRVGKVGSESTVVWNPWAEGARATADIEDDAWSTMLCVEAANVGEARVRLDPGQHHRMTTTIDLDRPVIDPDDDPRRPLPPVRKDSTTS